MTSLKKNYQIDKIHFVLDGWTELLNPFTTRKRDDDFDTIRVLY